MLKTTKPIGFILVSVIAGLAAAYIALKIMQEPTVTFREAPPSPAPANAQSGPFSYAQAVQQARPSVVNVFTSKITIQRRSSLLDDPIFQRFFGNRFHREPKKRLQTSLGSGVIINKDGYILTNHHVIASADEIKVVLSSGRTLQAKVVGTDPDTDLAVVKTETDDLPEITVGNSETLQVGDVVLAIGNPFGVGQTVTMGIVSATGRNQLGINTFENFIQTDAAINPGNSGGALINARGELVGINTAIFSKTGGSQGIGFAIPVDLAKGIMNEILKQGRVVRGWLGITGQDITPELAESFDLQEQSGVLVSRVIEGGAADDAGIELGDVITRIDNRIPSDSREFLNIISAQKPGTEIQIEGWRGKKRFTTEATISERPRVSEGIRPR
ncbi:Do family serine endopeptidase [Solemya velesiana gill symbiont]|uniref:Transcriptional regulator n=1 Tax=Solemya velesiana gill symbiont TaxID=1918948 RepID=A0A1T2KXA3_9GAMM|nr:Do family serine endopeptidase [Solemya velesiana gill symbiont]OOZ37421.1 transcriptional regulator [Solemya velesiana gill symbiont]